MGVSTTAEIAVEFKDKVHIFTERRAPPFAKFVLRTQSWAAAVLVDAISIGPSNGAVIQVKGLGANFENVFIYSVGENFYYEFQNIFLGNITKNVNPRQANESKKLMTGFVLRFGALSIRFERGLAPIVAPPSPVKPRTTPATRELENPRAKRQRTLSHASPDAAPVGIQPPVQPIGLPPSLQRRSEASEQAFKAKELDRVKLNGDANQSLSSNTEEIPPTAANISDADDEVIVTGVRSSINGSSTSSTQQQDQGKHTHDPVSEGPSAAIEPDRMSQAGSTSSPAEVVEDIAEDDDGPQTKTRIATRRNQVSSGESDESVSTESGTKASRMAPANERPPRTRRARKARAMFSDVGHPVQPDRAQTDSDDSVRQLIRQEKAQRQFQKDKEPVQEEGRVVALSSETEKRAAQEVSEEARGNEAHADGESHNEVEENLLRELVQREVEEQNERKRKEWQRIFDERVEYEREKLENERLERQRQWKEHELSREQNKGREPASPEEQALQEPQTASQMPHEQMVRQEEVVDEHENSPSKTGHQQPPTQQAVSQTSHEKASSQQTVQKETADKQLPAHEAVAEQQTPGQNYSEEIELNGAKRQTSSDSSDALEANEEPLERGSMPPQPDDMSPDSSSVHGVSDARENPHKQGSSPVGLQEQVGSFSALQDWGVALATDLRQSVSDLKDTLLADLRSELAHTNSNAQKSSNAHETLAADLRQSVSDLKDTLLADLRNELAHTNSTAQKSSNAHETLAAELRASMNSLRSDISKMQSDIGNLRNFVDTSVGSLTTRVSRAVRVITAVNDNCAQQLSSNVESAIAEISSSVTQKLDANMRLMNNNIAASMRHMQAILGSEHDEIDVDTNELQNVMSHERAPMSNSTG